MKKSPTDCVLAFGAHPDDLELGCGGTLAKLVKAGYTVHGVLLTSGDAGSLDIPRDELATTREKEAQAGADVLGLSSLTFLGRADASLSPLEDELLAQTVTLIRDLSPEIVFTHHAEDGHLDHQLTYQLVTKALDVAAGPWLQETEGAPCSPNEIYAYEVWTPMADFQVAVDISDTMETKLKALECHASQMADVAYHDAFEGLGRYRAVMTLNGGKYAEVFHVLKGGGKLQELCA